MEPDEYEGLEEASALEQKDETFGDRYRARAGRVLQVEEP